MHQFFWHTQHAYTYIYLHVGELQFTDGVCKLLVDCLECDLELSVVHGAPRLGGRPVRLTLELQEGQHTLVTATQP